MTASGGIDQYGVLKPVPPRVLAMVSLWVLIADGIFWGMSVSTLHVSEWICIAQGLLLCGSLILLSRWPALRIAVSLIATAIFGKIIYSFCGLLGFTALVALQIGLMHYCALTVLAPWLRKLKYV